MRLPLWAEAAAIAALVGGLVYAGWTVRGWKDKSDEAREVKAIERAIEVFRKHEEGVARLLEEKLSKLRANQKIVEIRRESIVDRPVYRNICLDDDGLRLIEAARTGQAPASQPAAQVPAVPQ
jgi:hypothetical protein